MGRRVQSSRSGDDTLKIRRERNRQAQHDFRKRRQAAEIVRQRRVKHLEDTIERLSEVVVGVCDDVLTLPEVLGRPGLMARLQGFMTEALRLAQSVVDSDDALGLIEESDVEEHINQDSSKTEIQSATASRQQSLPTPPTVDFDNTQSQTSSNTESHASTWEISHTPGLMLPFGFRLSAQTMRVPAEGLNNADTKPFPVQLVETTLSRACLLLSDPRPSPARLKRAFGLMIGQHCTQEELLRRVRWLLGPGYREIYDTAGANWRPPSIGGFQGLGLGSSVFPGTNDPKSVEGKTEPVHERTQREELLTALEVAAQLENLGARLVGSDTIELRLAEDKDAGEYSTMRHTPTIGTGANSPGVRLRLNSLLLTTNLSSVAKCVGFGPAYPRSQIAKAVEASVVFAWNS